MNNQDFSGAQNETPMIKVLSLTAILVLWTVPVFAQTSDVAGGRKVSNSEVSFQRPRLKESHRYVGCFGGPCTIPAGVNILTHHIEKTSPERPGLNKIIQMYRFVGRTGEKTFDIDRGTTIIAAPNIETGKVTVLHLYFSPGDVVSLSRSFDPMCDDSSDPMIKLKMIHLKENSLTHQIILPECMLK
jgi:hypothetical protein